MEKFELTIGARILQGVLHYVSDTAPVLITCHGLFSSKESDKFHQIAKAYTAEGYNVVRFDFGGCGESTGDIADTTVTSRLQDLDTVRSYIVDRIKIKGPFGILGSSFGGYVGLLHAARHPVAALSVWSTPCDLHEISSTIPAADLLKLKRGFFENAGSYDLPCSIKAMERVQVLHGSADELVPQEHAHRIFQALGEPREYVELQGADHAITQISSRRDALARSLAWFKAYLLRT